MEWAAIMTKLSDLERAKGLVTPAKKVAGRGRLGHRTRQATIKALQSELLQHLSVLEGGRGEEEAATSKDPKTHNNQAIGLQGTAPLDGGSGGKTAGKDVLHQHMGQAWPWGTVGQGTVSVLALPLRANGP